MHNWPKSSLGLFCNILLNFLANPIDSFFILFSIMIYHKNGQLILTIVGQSLDLAAMNKMTVPSSHDLTWGMLPS